MKEINTITDARAAAEDDVSRLLHGCDVPAEYRLRLVSYIQCWYLDQGHHGVRVCDLPHHTHGAATLAGVGRAC